MLIHKVRRVYYEDMPREKIELSPGEIAMLQTGASVLDTVGRIGTACSSHSMANRLLKAEERGVFVTGAAKGIVNDASRNKY